MDSFFQKRRLPECPRTPCSTCTRTQRWWPASAKWQRFIPIAKPSGTVSEVSTIGNSCIAPNNFPTIFSSIIRSREFVLGVRRIFSGKHCLPARHTIIRPSLLIYRPETTGGLECRVVPAGRLPPDPRLLDHADARQRSSLRPGQAPACRSSLGRPAMLRGGPDRLHQLLLGHHRPPGKPSPAPTPALPVCAWASRSSRSLRRCASW